MKKLILALIFALAAFAQTTYTSGIQPVTSNPGTCTPGTTADVFNTTLGYQVYCSATNTWSQGQSVKGNLLVGNTVFGSGQGISVLGTGAKGDGSTDDAAAINTALAAAGTLHVKVLIPAGATCVVATGLVLDQLNAVRLTSEGGSGDLGNYGTLKFTGSPAALILARSSNGIEIDHLQILYTNVGFTGIGIDTEHTGTGCGGGGCDSASEYFHDLLMTGAGSAVNAAALLSLDKTINSSIERVTLLLASTAISGKAAIGSYSNGIRIRGCVFGSSSASNFPSGDIVGYNQQWTVDGNTFEVGTGNQHIVANIGGSNTTGLIFSNNLVLDPGAYSGTMLSALSPGSIVTGNLVYLSSGTSGTFFSVAAAIQGLVVEGNYVLNGSLFASLGASSAEVVIHGNTIANVTTFYSGSAPTSGEVCDGSGNCTVVWPGSSTVSLGGVNLTPAYLTWGVYAATPAAATAQPIAAWTPDKAITITRITAFDQVNASGCTTSTVFVTDGTNSATLSIANGNNPNTSTFSQNFSAGVQLTVEMTFVGCGTRPQQINTTFEYVMQ